MVLCLPAPMPFKKGEKLTFRCLLYYLCFRVSEYDPKTGNMRGIVEFGLQESKLVRNTLIFSVRGYLLYENGEYRFTMEKDSKEKQSLFNKMINERFTTSKLIKMLENKANTKIGIHQKV